MMALNRCLTSKRFLHLRYLLKIASRKSAPARVSPSPICPCTTCCCHWQSVQLPLVPERRQTKPGSSERLLPSDQRPNVRSEAFDSACLFEHRRKISPLSEPDRSTVATNPYNEAMLLHDQQSASDSCARPASVPDCCYGTACSAANLACLDHLDRQLATRSNFPFLADLLS